MKWLGSHRSFAVETFFTNSGSITATQRLFRTHFKLGRHDPVPSRNTILLWIKNFRKNGSALKRQSTGRPRTSTTPENAMAVKASVQQSPQRSARKHAAALRISATSVRRILHMMINRVIDNFHKRVNLCVNNHGKRLTDLIFKT